MVNIFVTSRDPIRAARELPDMLVPRMCLEAAEILCGAHWNLLYGDNKPNKASKNDPPWNRSLGQRRHPSVLWAGSNIKNYDWVLTWFQELASEHLMRYGKRTSYCEAYMQCGRYLKEHRNRFEGAKGSSEFILVTQHEKIKNLDISVISRYKVLMVYKYAYEYKRNVRWTNVDLPTWLHDERIHRWLQKKFGEPIRKLPTTFESELKSFSKKHFKQIQAMQP